MNAFYWAIIAALLWGIVPVLEKVGLTKVQPLAGLFYRCLGVLIGLFLLLLFLVKPQQIKSVDFRSASFLITAGFLASFVAQIAFYSGLKSGEVSRVVPIAGSFPLISFILGIFFLSESITPMKFLGVILVTMGVWALKIG
ncbi:MAG: hypothetical protein DRP74_03315 [Candidatus Omnitrophota bacterium]|nr:MAG: hypothetical protein DRP74_03315 [Candidatus Omnitrophota bacterium]